MCNIFNISSSQNYLWRKVVFIIFLFLTFLFFPWMTPRNSSMDSFFSSKFLRWRDQKTGNEGPHHWFTPQIPAMKRAGLCQNQPWGQELNAGLPWGWQGPNGSHFQLPLEMNTSRKMDLKAGQQLKASTWGMWETQRGPSRATPNSCFLLDESPLK